MLVTVCRWHRSAATEGRWGSLTKCGVTRLVTICRVYDSPSCRFVVKFREVIPVPRFQELKCFGTKTLDGTLCLWRSVILAIEGNEESSRRNCTSMGRKSPQRSVEGLCSKTLQLLESGYWDHFSELHNEPVGRTVIDTTDCHKLRNPTLGWTSPSSFSSCTAATYRPSQARRTVISSVGGLFCISSLKISAFRFGQISCKTKRNLYKN